MAQQREGDSARDPAGTAGKESARAGTREDAPEPVPAGAAGGDGIGGGAVVSRAEQRRDFFGHPRGLATLFFTEFWERFSYYGMRALLVLFMASAATGANPGLGFEESQATAIYGLYTFFVYVLALPGGWVADNLWGQRRSVFVGGCIIAAGHFAMAGPLVGLPDAPSFFTGLVLIVLGTGLLKPNVSSMVGELYPEGGAARDAGFSIFYMGINFGAILGPTLCGILGESYNWHWGFSLAGFGMLIGLFSYKVGEANLGDAGRLRADASSQVLARRSRTFWSAAGGVAALIALFGYLMSTGAIALTLEGLAGGLGVATVAIALGFFAFVIFLGGHTTSEKKRLGVILWLFLLAALFWSGFEQAGSSFNLFAMQQTDRLFGPVSWLDGFGVYLPALLVALPLLVVVARLFSRSDLWIAGKAGVAGLGLLVVGFVYYVSTQLTSEWQLPASLLQNINPTFIVILAPIFGWTWTWLASRDANPSIPAKFALGLFGLAAGFFVISWGAANATGPGSVSIAWLVVTYFLHTCGELCLSPVGLSSMTKLAPENRVGQMMGMWFVASALGNLIGGLIAGQLQSVAASSLFFIVACIIGGGGLVALLASPFVRRLIGDVE